MFLAEDQQYTIITELGFALNPDSVIDYLSVDLHPVTVNRITVILERLEAIENFRQANLGDTLAVKVGTIELSYNQHYQRLYLEAWSLINELASFLFPTSFIFANKYEVFLSSSSSSICHVDFK